MTHPVNLGKLGFEEDGVADTKNHGGIDKAVCAYSLDYYPYWEEVLSSTLQFIDLLHPLFQAPATSWLSSF